jgi:hypothetical protein
VVGCLQAAPSSSTGTSGTASPAAGTTDAAKPDVASGAAKFVLANAVPSSVDNAATVLKSSAPQTYVLIANEAALNPHVGKRVELTGVVDDQNSSARSGTSNGSSATSSAASAPKLRVEAGKVLAEACTQ